MSTTYPMTGHSDKTLRRMLDFFAIYKPRPSDIAWAKRRKAEVEAEIARRKLEDEEGMQ